MEASEGDDAQVNERKQVTDYLRVNELEGVLNGVLNEIVTDRPQDPYLALSGVLVDYSKQSRKIINVRASEVLGPTGCYLQVEVETTKGAFGAVIGGYGYDDDTDKQGHKGYQKLINTLTALVVPKLRGIDPADQAAVDKLLCEDNTLADVAKLAVSLAVCRAGAKQRGEELYQYIAETANCYTLCVPVPHLTLVEGGRNANNQLHARGVTVIPHGAKDITDAVKSSLQIQRHMETVLKSQNDLQRGVNGGLAPSLSTMDEALVLVRDAIKAAGAENKVAFGLDVGAADFADMVRRGGEDDAVYNLSTWDPDVSPPVIKKKDDMVDIYTELLVKHPFVSISEPFHAIHRTYYGRMGENMKQYIQGSKGEAVDAYKLHFDGIGGDHDCIIQVVGDTALKSEADIEDANLKKTMNTVRVTLRKAGTVTNLIKLVQKAHAVGFAVILAADGRDYSDLLDTFVSHAAVGLRVGQVDFGPARHAEQLEKYNELLRIERTGQVPYAGNNYRSFH